MASSIGPSSSRCRKDLAGGDTARPLRGVEQQGAVGIEIDEAAGLLALREARRLHLAEAEGTAEPGGAHRREASDAPAAMPFMEMSGQRFEHGHCVNAPGSFLAQRGGGI